MSGVPKPGIVLLVELCAAPLDAHAAGLKMGAEDHGPVIRWLASSDAEYEPKMARLVGQRIADSIEAKPGLFGFSIDIKRLFRKDKKP